MSAIIARLYRSSIMRDISGKIILITGANSGLGFATAKSLVQRNAIVIFGCRNMELGQQAIESIRRDILKNDEIQSNRQLHLLQIDLSSFDSIRKFVDEFNKRFSHLDVLINNAGIMGHPLAAINKTNVEMHFAVNHLGHFLLTNLLVDKLNNASSTARIIIVTSGYYKRIVNSVNFEGIQNLSIQDVPELLCVHAFSDVIAPNPINYSPINAYALSKLANCLHTIALARRFADDHKISVFAVRPGFVRGTNLGRETPTIMRWIAAPLIWMIAKDIDHGIESILYCCLASDDDTSLESGALYYESKKETYAPIVDEETAEKLWTFSQNLID